MPLLSMTLLSTPPLLLLLLLLLLHSSTVQVHGSIPRAPARAPALAAVSPVQLPLAEVEALLSIYHENGGAQWQYKKGTDAVGGGMPWNVINMGGGRFFTSLVPAVVLPDPCSEGWFGVECLNGHVSKLFINTRYSGNKMTGVRLFELFLCYMCSSCCTCVCWFSDDVTKTFLIFYIEIIENQPTRGFFCSPPGRRLLLTPAMGIRGGGEEGSIFVPSITQYAHVIVLKPIF